MEHAKHVEPEDKIDALIEAQEEKEAKELDELDLGWRDAPSLFLFAALFVTVFLQFFTRYVLNDSLSFTEELARYLLIVLTFVGAIRCQLRDSQIRLEFVDDLAKKYLRHLRLFSLGLGVLFFGYFTYALWMLIERTWRLQMISLPFPKYYLYLAVMGALVVILAIHLRQIWTLLKGGRS